MKVALIYAVCLSTDCLLSSRTSKLFILNQETSPQHITCNCVRMHDKSLQSSVFSYDVKGKVADVFIQSVEYFVLGLEDNDKVKLNVPDIHWF